MQALMLAIKWIAQQVRPWGNRVSRLGLAGGEIPYDVLFIDPENLELRSEIKRALMREDYRLTIQNAKRLGLDA
jgi:hypothetical protein